MLYEVETKRHCRNFANNLLNNLKHRGVSHLPESVSSPLPPRPRCLEPPRFRIATCSTALIFAPPLKASAEKMATLEGYRSLLEEALARLIEAEAKLEDALQPSLEDDVDVVKQMYYDHEVNLEIEILVVLYSPIGLGMISSTFVTYSIAYPASADLHTGDGQPTGRDG